MVSIIIPTYNRANLIGETLDSVLAQTYQDWECIVVDDGSTDTTEKIVMAFAKANERFSYFRRPENLPKGANTCRNFGFQKSKGKFIKWFDSDDIFVADHLKKSIAPFLNKNDLDVVICLHQTFEDVPQLIENKNLVFENIDLKKFVLRKQFFQTGSALWKRSFLSKIKGFPILFDPELTQSQDYDFHVRALLYNPVIKHIKEKLYHLRRGNNSISSEFLASSELHLKSFLRVKYKFGELFKEDTEILIGLFNHVLESLRKSLSQPDKKIFQMHLESVKKWQDHFKLMSKKRAVFLIYLSHLIFETGKGSYFFKDFYQLKKIS